MPGFRLPRTRRMRENHGHVRLPPEPRPHPAMTVHCPHCSTGYLLPDHLIGPGGARVRCPECQGGFAVVRDRIGEPGVDAYPLPGPDALSPSSAAPVPSARHERAPAPVVAPAPTPPSAAEVAAAVVDEMVAAVGG